MDEMDAMGGYEDEQGEPADEGMDPGTRLRRYRIAVADYRLERSEFLWPCVAAMVDAAFALFDPVRIMPLCDGDDVADRYDAVASSVWDGLCGALLQSVGQEEGVVTVTRERLQHILWTSLEEAFDGKATYVFPNSRGKDDAAFAAIIAAEFGEEVPSPAGSDTGAVTATGCGVRPEPFTIEWDQVDTMIGVLHARCGRLRFPWHVVE